MSKEYVVASLSVVKLEGQKSSFALFIDLPQQQGALCIAEGTSKRMHELLRQCKPFIKNNWEPANCICNILWPTIPTNDRPRKVGMSYA